MSEELFERYLRNELDEDGARELSAILAGEEGARDFAAFVQEWTLLGEAARQRVAAADRAGSRRIRKIRPARETASKAWIGWAAGLVAAAAFMIALATPGSLPPKEEKQTVRVEPPAPALAEEPRPAPATPPSPPPPPAPPRSEPERAPLPPPAPRVETPTPPAPAPPPPREKVPETRPEPEKKVARSVLALLGRVQGDIQILSPVGRRKAVAGEGLGADEGVDAAGSGSHATLDFPDGSRIELGADTSVEKLVEKQGKRGLALSRGSIAATVTKQAAGRSLTVTTAHAEVTVIGTQFSLSALPDSSRLEVREGRVLLRRLPDGASIEVSAGHLAVAAKGVKLESKPIVYTKEFPVAADTSISGADPSRAFGAEEQLEVDGDETEGKKIYGLLRWDFSELPAGAVVKSAVVTLYVVDASQGVGYSFYEMRRAWSEAEATWRLAATGSPWRSAGARSPAERGSEALGTLAPRTKGEVRILLNPAAEGLIQSWIRLPASNHGFVIANDNNTDGFKFYSRESSHADRRPRLTLTYTLSAK
jgi:ferric-dicitrate binding protein FerR (iron transport regulator)